MNGANGEKDMNNVHNRDGKQHAKRCQSRPFKRGIPFAEHDSQTEKYHEGRHGIEQIRWLHGIIDRQSQGQRNDSGHVEQRQNGKHSKVNSCHWVGPDQIAPEDEIFDALIKAGQHEEQWEKPQANQAGFLQNRLTRLGRIFAGKTFFTPIPSVIVLPPGGI